MSLTPSRIMLRALERVKPGSVSGPRQHHCSACRKLEDDMYRHDRDWRPTPAEEIVTREGDIVHTATCAFHAEQERERRIAAAVGQGMSRERAEAVHGVNRAAVQARQREREEGRRARLLAQVEEEPEPQSLSEADFEARRQMQLAAARALIVDDELERRAIQDEASTPNELGAAVAAR